MTHIELNQVRKTYPRQLHPAADDLSLTMTSGSLTALLGPSGSGKSTLLKLIAGIESLDHGAISFDGQDVHTMPAHQRGAVLMFQKAYLFPFLTVAENIAFGLHIRRVDRVSMRADVQRMLDLVELPGIGQKYPAQLSGGEQQRVALARALVIRPRVLLLDEPFSSLDPAIRQMLQEAVRRIQRELQITTLLVTHDRTEALAMADQVALLDQGHLLACATPRRLFERPPTRRAAQLMGVTTFLRGELAGDRLQTDLGVLQVGTEPTSPGCVTYAIRPECKRLWNAPGPNRLLASIIGQTFHGERSEYQIRVGDRILRIYSAQPITGAANEQLYVELPAEHLFPVADDTISTKLERP
ncbi:MAG TPA: ABC transporter ATP-binding protein [Roseiflexaceae bacterium]|nr:ABC transporter ATP-binding protein [Roseiflexaceae bacterium]